MADTRSTDQRRRIMQSVGTKNTGPEIRVRRLLHALGFRFRLHRKDLPGSPDIVLPKHRTAIFVHGCFWHGHGCAKGQPPKSHSDYWLPKIAANRARDSASVSRLAELGWATVTIWQCETDDSGTIEELVKSAIRDSAKNSIDGPGQNR